MQSNLTPLQPPLTMSDTETSRDMPESEILKEILESTSEELHTLSDLRTFRAWDFSWPTLTKPRRFTGRHSYASDEAFFSTIENHNHGVSHGLLQAVGAFKENNSVVLYGGALVDIVTKREDSIKDWDLRLVGEEYVESPEKCVQAAKQFVADVFTWIRSENERIQIKNQERKQSAEGGNYTEEPLLDIQQVKTSRSKSTVTMVIPKKWNHNSHIKETVLQFTYAPYKTIQDLFAHSTPHCTRLAVKDKAVSLDSSAKYCLESLCVVLDARVYQHFDCSEEAKKPDVQSRSFREEMKRACKYFNVKGFDIVLPELDIKKLPDRNLKFNLQEALDLPELTIIYSRVDGNKVMADRVVPSDHGGTSERTNDAYDGEGASYNVGESIHHNIRCLVANVYDRFQFVTEGEVTEPVFDYAPLLTIRMIDKSYETVGASLSSGIIEVNKVIQYFSATPPAQVFEKLLVSPINDTATERGTLPEPFKFDKEVLGELVSKEKKAISAKLKTVRTMMQDAGLDKLVVDFPETPVSSKDEVLKALYGDYMLRSED